MIVSRLENSSRIESLHPLFKQLFDYVKTHDLLNAPLGRIELDGDNLFINNVNPECVPADKQVLEMHRDYIDVHILLTGQELSVGRLLKRWNIRLRLTKRRETVRFIAIDPPCLPPYNPVSLPSFIPKTRMLRLSVKEKSEN